MLTHECVDCMHMYVQASRLGWPKGISVGVSLGYLEYSSTVGSTIPKARDLELCKREKAS